MEIKILGSKGCQVCGSIEMEVFNALAELDVDASVEKVEDSGEILRYNVIVLPGLVINNKMKIQGRAPRKPEIISFIKEELDFL